METAGKRVLVIDDDAVLLRTVARELRAAGWTVDARTEPGWVDKPDVALIDWDPHGKVATEAARKMGVPYVVFTGNDVVADALRAAGDAVVDKPWQSGELDAELKEVCKHG